MDYEAIFRTILEKSPKVKAKDLISKTMQMTKRSRSTLYDHLSYFVLRERIIRQKGWYSLPKPTRTTLKHSKQLSLGFEAILAEDWVLYEPSDESKLTAHWRDLVDSEGSKLKQYAIEHLETDSPEIFNRMQRWKRLRKRIIEMRLKNGSPIGEARRIVDLSRVSRLSTILSKQTASEEDQKLVNEGVQAYRALQEGINLVILRIEAGERLKGRCRLCSE